MKLLAACLLAACATAACSSGASCPSGSTVIANYNVSYTQLSEGDTCYVTLLPDGGPTNYQLVSSPSQNSMQLCATGQDGGAVTVFLAGQQLGQADASVYTQASNESDVTGSACLCALDLTDKLSVNFATADGGPVAWDPTQDGGIPSIPSFAGTLDYGFSHTASDTSLCACSPMPCGAHYSFSGTRE